MLDAFQLVSDPESALKELQKARSHLRSMSQKFGKQTEVLQCYEYSIELLETWLHGQLDPNSSASPLEVVKGVERPNLLQRSEYQDTLQAIFEALQSKPTAANTQSIVAGITILQRLLPDLEGFYWPMLGSLLLKELTVRRTQ